MRVLFKHKNGRQELMDKRSAKVLNQLGRGTYMTRDMQAASYDSPQKPVENSQTNPESEDLTQLRSEYQELVGKRAYHGWDADELRKRIDEALAG